MAGDRAQARATLRPMTEAEFAAWRGPAIRAYAEDKSRSLNISEEEAMALSVDSFDKELPQGLGTANNYLFTARNEDDTPVGMAWIAVDTARGVTTAFVFDILIEEPYRGRGYGRSVMLALEEEARKHGVTRMGLHVFGDNPRAQALYARIGYKVTDVSMAKDIGSGES